MSTSMGYCSACRARTRTGHGSTATHRRATRPIGSGAWLAAGRPGWMIALRSDPDAQYAGRWPDYPLAAEPPLIGDEAY